MLEVCVTFHDMHRVIEPRNCFMVEKKMFRDFSELFLSQCGL